MFRFETLSDLIVGILVTLSFNHVVLTQANLAQHNIYYWCSGASAAPNLHVPAKETSRLENFVLDEDWTIDTEGKS